mmetsp:Transcript_58262/g.131968  ORF Transcript_58262/g.131968 Transcript_58262/m.131968 type:complete len:226 (+) Transcript_58262:17-694(+)
MANLRFRRGLETILSEWDEARGSWQHARDRGQRLMVALANSATALGHFSAETPEGQNLRARFGDAVVNAGEAKVYDSLLLAHRDLHEVLKSFEVAGRRMAAAADAMEVVAVDHSESKQAEIPTPAKDLQSLAPKRAPLLVTHDPASLGSLLREVAEMHQAQAAACADTVGQSEPDMVRAAASNVLNLRASVWLMDPFLDNSKIDELDRVRRTELDPMSQATFLSN